MVSPTRPRIPPRSRWILSTASRYADWSSWSTTASAAARYHCSAASARKQRRKSSGKRHRCQGDQGSRTKGCGQRPPTSVESKPDVAAALAPAAGTKLAPSGPKGRVMPAVPRPGGQPKATAAPATTVASQKTTTKTVHQTTTTVQQNTAQAAAAAVAAAMAKLPMAAGNAQQQPPANRRDGTEGMTRKFQELRTDDPNRQHNHTGQNFRGAGRGRGRGSGREPAKGVDIPTTDFDFEQSNKKFNKQDLAKEAHVSHAHPDPGYANGSSAGAVDHGTSDDVSSPTGGEEEFEIPPAPLVYDKKSSFFDNISSEQKDREEKRSLRRNRIPQ